MSSAAVRWPAVQIGQMFDTAEPDVRGVRITQLAYDNRAVTPGALFFCVRGFTQDGHAFAADAVERGAAALVVDRRLELEVPQLVVDDVRAAMAPAAAAFNGHPTRELRTVGVTGTNGKTTTAYLTRALLEAAGLRTGLLGTVKSVVGGVERPVERTTPEAIDLQRTFREMVEGGDVACAFEVSSHALALHRVDAIDYDVAIFTNLTQDHLDFHQTMEEYFLAKRRLFTELGPAHAVINVDDPFGLRLARELRGAVDLMTIAIENDTAGYRAVELRGTLTDSTFTITGPDGRHPVSSPLPGRFNVLNVLAAFAAARALGVDADTAVAGLRGAGQVPGRFETVDAGQPFAVLVDYAHTPDSLDNVLRAARQLSGSGRLHVVFGAGGDRDRGKRPLMGEVAARLADRVIVTSDNPRSEDPQEIIDQVIAGIAGAVESEADRAAAIGLAIDTAEPGDVVVIAGKGHEQGQEFTGGRKIPFDDVTVARAALRRRWPHPAPDPAAPERLQ